MSETENLYDNHDPDELPSELRPLSNVDWDELDSRRIEQLVERLPDDLLDDVPADDRLVRGILATGIGIRVDDEVKPTVAGVVAFGIRPHLRVPGLRVAVSGDVSRRIEGPLPAMMAELATTFQTRLGDTASDLLFAHVLAWRSWAAQHHFEPIEAIFTGARLQVRFPATPPKGAPNPVLSDLLWRMKWIPSKDARPKPLAIALRKDGATGLRFGKVHGTGVIEMRLPSREIRVHAEPTENDPALRRRTVPPMASTKLTPPTVSSRCTPSVPEKPRQAVPSGQRLSKPTNLGIAPSHHRSAADRRAELLRQLARGPLTRRDLQDCLGWTRSTLRNVLRCAVDDGVIEAQSPSPRSPFQSYRLA